MNKSLSLKNFLSDQNEQFQNEHILSQQNLRRNII